MNSAPLAVYWPDKAGGQKWLLGRPVLGYENIDHWILDPDALISSHMQYSKKMLKPFLISKRIRSRVTRLRQTAALL
jgi:hypothetical protein